MPEELSDLDLKTLWLQGDVPTIFKPSKPLPVLVKLPYAKKNLDWLRNDRRSKPKWSGKYKAWEIPAAWFDSVIRLILRRYAEAYVILLCREQQKCAPACWNAEGCHCDCLCMREILGCGHPGGSWYEVSETFAVSWGVQRYSCRHLRVKMPGG